MFTVKNGFIPKYENEVTLVSLRKNYRYQKYVHDF